MFYLKNKQRGFAAFYITILIMGVVFALSLSISLLSQRRQKIYQDIIKSNQAYYSAEAGLEDGLLRLTKKMNWVSPYIMDVGGNSATITISDIIGGSRTITSQGTALNCLRKLSAAYEISPENPSFHYGAQVGEGGLIMDDGSTVNGNVFSNGNILAQATAEITGTAKVAQTGNYINGATIGQDAYVDTCQNSVITGTLTCANNISCTAPTIEPLTEEIPANPLPISQTQIDKWATEALSGGVIALDYILEGNNQDSLGPVKIEGNLDIKEQAQLFITGTLWVTGQVTIQNKARVQLDPTAYGSRSGILVANGIVNLKDTAKALGSGEFGSYLLILSTDAGTSAITVQNSFEADILYTQNGWILVKDSANVREVSGYGIHLQNNAEIIYEIGLADPAFTTGPGGGWNVTSWKEIE